MAITNEKSTQITKLSAQPRQELAVDQVAGRLRVARFDFTQGAVAGDVGSTAELCRLPAGARILANLSYIRWSAFGVARTLDVGLRAHKNAQTGAQVAEAAAALVNDLNVASAGVANLASNGTIAGDSYKVAGEADVFATVAGDTIPAGATLKGDIVYVVD